MSLLFEKSQVPLSSLIVFIIRLCTSLTLKQGGGFFFVSVCEDKGQFGGFTPNLD